MGLPVPPKVYHPRAVVVISALLDDQIPGSAGIPVTYQAIPRRAEWSRNSARKADTAMVELDFRDFPLDPRMLRDVLVQVHAQDVFVPQRPPVPTRGNLRFIGLVDTPETKLGESGESVTFQCRDYTGIWLDTKLGFGAPPLAPPISLLQPLQTIVESLRLLVTPLLPPVVFTDPSSASFVPGRTKGKTLLTVGKDQSAWDILSELCQLYGLLPVFELDALTIRTATRTGAQVRSLIYGQNVSRLSFKRSLTRSPKTRRIAVNAWNPILGIPVRGVFEPPGARAPKLGESGASKIKLVEVSYNVIGNYTAPELIILAKRIYDEQATQEIEGEIETRELVDSTELSLLGLANGDTMFIRLGRELQTSIEGMGPAEAVAFLSSVARPNALPPVVAQALVMAWTTAGKVAVSFYIREATHTWSHDRGYSLRATFVNFLIGQGI